MWFYLKNLQQQNIAIMLINETYVARENMVQQGEDNENLSNQRKSKWPTSTKLNPIQLEETDKARGNRRNQRKSKWPASTKLKPIKSKETDGAGRKAAYLEEIRLYGGNRCSWMKPENHGQKKPVELEEIRIHRGNRCYFRKPRPFYKAAFHCTRSGLIKEELAYIFRKEISNKLST